MVYAVAQMDPLVQVLFYGAALALFLIAGFRVGLARLDATALGLAAAVFPTFWNALAAA